MSKKNFKGKVVIITGACGGLGSALCKVFGKQGAKVIATDINKNGIEEFCNTLKDQMDIFGYHNDVTSEENVKEVAAKIIEEHQQIDILINNAGMSHLSKFSETDTSVMRRILNVNLFGALYWTSVVLPYLKKSQGMVISISSVAGYAPLYARTMYCASKYALHGCFETLRTEEPSIHVMMVCPSFIKTKIDDNAVGGDGKPAQKNRVHIGKQMTPDYAALSIFKAAQKRKKLLLLGRISKLSYFVNRVSRSLYARIMRNKFASELG